MKTNQTDSFTHSIPYYAHYKGATILTDGTIFVGLKLSGLDTYTLPQTQLEGLKGQFKNLFQQLPVGYHVQIIHDYHSDLNDRLSEFEQLESSSLPIGKAFRESAIKKLKNDRALRVVDLYLFVIFKPQRQKGFDFVSKIFSKFGRKDKNVGLDNSYNKEESLAGLLARESGEVLLNTSRLINSLKTLLGIDATILGEHDLYRFIYKFLNPGVQYKKPQREEGNRNYFSDYMTMREFLSHTACEAYSDMLKLGNMYCKTLTLKVPSRFSRLTDDEAILSRISFPFLWSYNFKILDSAKKNSELEMKQKRKHAFLSNKQNPNVDSSISKGEIEQALSDQKMTGFSWHDASMSFVIFADSVELLNERALSLISIFRDFEESVLAEENYAQLKYFIASLPGCGHYNDRNFLLNSLNVADMAPLSCPPIGTESLSFYLHTYRNTPFRFSTFSDEFNSWNQVVIGKIGSGKSFMVNNLLNMALMGLKHPRVMILDLGKSFARTTELWGGEYIPIDLDSDDCGLNPLPPHDNIKPNGNHSILGLLDFTVQLLLLMAGRNDSNKKLEGRIVRKALEYTYSSVKNRDPILTDFHQTLLNYDQVIECDEVDSEIAHLLAKLLEDFVVGPYSKIFNRPSTFNFKTDFFCFDFKDAHSNPAIREIATYVIGGYICRKMTSNPEPKIIIFDEFATTMQHETGAALCKMIAKNCRKHGVSFICISQELEDFLHNPAAQAVYQQANFKWYLKMDDNLKKYQEHLKLSDEDIAIIKSLTTQKGHFSEVYLNYGSKKALLNLRPDPLIYWACTTDAYDKRMEIAYRKHFSDYSTQQLLTVLSQNYPNGVTSHDFKNDSIYQEWEAKCAA